MAEIKLAEPVRKLIGEKEAEVQELTKKMKNLESRIEGTKDELDKLRAEKEELSAALKEKDAEINDLKLKLGKSEKMLAKAKEEGGRAEVPLEELVYVYILGADGEIAIPKCARALGVKKKRVKDAIDKLIKSGRLER